MNPEILAAFLLGLVFGIAVCTHFELGKKMRDFRLRMGAMGHAAKHKGAFETCPMDSCLKLRE